VKFRHVVHFEIENETRDPFGKAFGGASMLQYGDSFGQLVPITKCRRRSTYR
jgi:hypothetical protein